MPLIHMRCFHPSALQTSRLGSRKTCAYGFAVLIFSLFTAAEASDSIKLASSPAVSADGKTLVFAWADDIWLAATEGGEAKRLTIHPAPDSKPIIARDGKSVFFNSVRTGSTQVFRIPITGGTPEQLF